MAEIRLICPECGAKLCIPDDAVGKQVKCSSCGGKIQIPFGAPPEPETNRRRIRKAAHRPLGHRLPLFVLILLVLLPLGAGALLSECLWLFLPRGTATVWSIRAATLTAAFTIIWISFLLTASPLAKILRMLRSVPEKLSTLWDGAARLEARKPRRTANKHQEVSLSKESHVYHLPSCNHAKRIKDENRIVFDSPQWARAARYAPCAQCKPPVVEPTTTQMKQLAESNKLPERAPTSKLRSTTGSASGAGAWGTSSFAPLGSAGKVSKLLTYKTARGKTNILIDMLCHGRGRTGYVIDEILHTINEGSFNPRKFLRYGNMGRIFGIPSTSRMISKLFKL